MTKGDSKYCLDANVLIQAWQKYYAPDICPSYWEVLNEFGKVGKLFLPELVYEEITRTDDELSRWLKNSEMPILKIDEEVTKRLQDIYNSNPDHKYLVNHTKQRSLADPWVIAHAMKESAIVVTKEEKLTIHKPTKIKIPNVCENMDVKWIDDFQLARELSVIFKCEVVGG